MSRRRLVPMRLFSVLRQHKRPTGGKEHAFQAALSLSRETQQTQPDSAGPEAMKYDRTRRVRHRRPLARRVHFAA